MICTRCYGSGYLNTHQPPDSLDVDDLEAVRKWMDENADHDVQVCDCCGDGESWYGRPGAHYEGGDDQGEFGPYAYNGGLCECHWSTPPRHASGLTAAEAARSCS
jgi:hypothetical protein